MRKTNILNDINLLKRLAIVNIANLVIKNNINLNGKIVVTRSICTPTKRSIKNLYILLRNKKYKYLIKLYHYLLYNDDIKNLVIN